MKKIKYLIVTILIIALLLSSMIVPFADIVLLGDANLNEELDISDVTIIQRHLASITTLSGTPFYRADSNDDGYLTIADATKVQLCLSKQDYPRYREIDDEVHYPFVPF